MPKGIADFAIGQSVSHAFVVSAADMEAFQRLAGDDSSIHTDDAFARERGFKGVIVYGGIMLAQLSRVLGTMVPGRHGVSMSWSINYRKPLYVGEPALLTATVSHVSEATSSISLSFTISRAGEVVAAGKTESLVLS